MSDIALQASVAEIEEILRRKLRESDTWYMQDHHFRQNVVPEISLEEALAFADKLDAECMHGTCSKARHIRSYLLDNERWREGNGPSYVLSFARRTHCWSHEAGSFFKRD